jgi:hypothetical protein
MAQPGMGKGCGAQVASEQHQQTLRFQVILSCGSQPPLQQLTACIVLQCCNTHDWRTHATHRILLLQKQGENNLCVLHVPARCFSYQLVNLRTHVQPARWRWVQQHKP